MANKARIKIKLQSTQSDQFYTTSIKKVPNAVPLKRKKYDSRIRKHVLFEQKKI